MYYWKPMKSKITMIINFGNNTNENSNNKSKNSNIDSDNNNSQDEDEDVVANYNVVEPILPQMIPNDYQNVVVFIKFVQTYFDVLKSSNVNNKILKHTKMHIEGFLRVGMSFTSNERLNNVLIKNKNIETRFINVMATKLVDILFKDASSFDAQRILKLRFTLWQFVFYNNNCNNSNNSNNNNNNNDNYAQRIWKDIWIIMLLDDKSVCFQMLSLLTQNSGKDKKIAAACVTKFVCVMVFSSNQMTNKRNGKEIV